MAEPPSPYITHKYFNTALVSLFAALIVFVIYLSQLIDAASEKQMIAIEKQDEVLRRYILETRENLAKDAKSNRDQVRSALESYSRTRDTALTAANKRLEASVRQLDGRFLAFGQDITSQVQAIRSQVNLMTTDMIALGRMQVTDRMLRRMISETLGSRTGKDAKATNESAQD